MMPSDCDPNGARTMTDKLHTFTRKRLAAMARSRHVPGWHEMRKADLITALNAQPAEDDPSAFPATFPIEHEGPAEHQGGSASNGWHSSAASARNGAGRTARQSRPLLHSEDRDDDRFVVRCVSPHWIRAEWKLSHRTLNRTQTALGIARLKAEPVLRLYEVADDERLTHAVTFVSDTGIPGDAHEWFVQVDQPGGIYQLHLGILTDDGEFHRLVSSDRIDTKEPLSLPAAPLAPSTSAASPGVNGRKPAGRTTIIPLKVEAELTIRGTTHPRAMLAVGTESLPLDEDGSFQYRRSLADGRHIIPTTALSPDGRREHTIVIALECNTKHLTPLEPDEV
jgi:uncharacterized protein